MALTFTEVQQRDNINFVPGKHQRGLVDITLDDSYPTGGWSIASHITADLVVSELVDLRVPSIAGFLLEFDRANSKILAYYADYDAAADGALIQLPNTSDLLDAKVIRCQWEGIE